MRVLKTIRPESGLVKSQAHARNICEIRLS